MSAKPPFDERQSKILDDMYADHHLRAAVREGLDLRQEVAQKMAEEMNAANRSAINTKGFELEAERMGHLMRDKYRIGFIDVGGWDTHVGEGAAQGSLANNLASLGRGLQAFSQSLGAEWNNTVVVVLSEFGRTFRENGNRGTDHGHGTVYWVLGGAHQRWNDRRRAARRGPRRLAAGPRFPGAQRLSRRPRRALPEALGTIGRSVRPDFPAGRPEGFEARLALLERAAQSPHFSPDRSGR